LLFSVAFGVAVYTPILYHGSPISKAFGHRVMEGTMAQSEAGRSPAERGVGIVVLIIVTL